MAIAFRNGTTKLALSSAGGATLDRPTGLASGDIWICVLRHNSAGLSNWLISGFTRFVDNFVSTSGTRWQSAFYRFCDGSEPATVTATWTGGGDPNLASLTAAWSGAPASYDTSTTISQSGSGTVDPLPDITVTYDNSLDVLIAMEGSSITWSTWTIGTEVVDGNGIGCAWRTASAGSSTGQTVTASATSDNRYAGIRVAFGAAPAGGGIAIPGYYM